MACAAAGMSEPPPGARPSACDPAAAAAMIFCLSASGIWLMASTPSVMLAVTWFCSTAPRIAMPMRLPTWRIVESTPEALPTRSLGAVAMTAEVTGATASPMPMPVMRNGTSRLPDVVCGSIFVHAGHQAGHPGQAERQQEHAGGDDPLAARAGRTARRRAAPRR